MTRSDGQNPYDFQPFLDWRDAVDYWDADPFLRRVVRAHAGDAFPAVDAAARALSAKASHRWRDLADQAATPERRPFVQAWDAHHRRVDRVVRSPQTEALEREVFGEGLFSERTGTVERLAKMVLVYENGEACVACPLVCTEGMVAILRRFADRPETRAILRHVAEGEDGDFGIGAQFLSEIQGGSDVPANVCAAVPDGDAWRLHGTKFFCSVAHADYAVVTARPAGSDKVGLFVAPLWADGAKGLRRNGLTVDRLKWKMGTSELPTAEMTFDGARAFAVGPLDRGVANVVGVVLTLSRLTVGLASAAYMARAAREAAGYAAFREAFGQRIDGFPMVAAQLQDLQGAARRTMAAAFEIYRRFAESGGLAGAPDASPEARRRTFEARELVMLHKFVSAEDCTLVVRQAMAIFGGHGVIEDFSSLPRLFRDSAVNELWEGPTNVLQAQVHRDLRKAASWYPADAFVRSLLDGAAPSVVEPLASEVAAIVAHPGLESGGAGTVAMCRRWDAALRALVHAFQDRALARVEAHPA